MHRGARLSALVRGRPAGDLVLPGGVLSWSLSSLSLALAAYAVNAYLVVPVFGSMSLAFGQSIAVLVLLMAGWRAALVVALGAAGGLVAAGAPPAEPFLAVLEILALAVLLRRHVPVALGALLFWLVIGVPLSYAFADRAAPAAEHVLRFEILVAAVNGLLNASLAGGVFQLLIRTIARRRYGGLREIDLSRQVFAMTLTLALLPAVAISLGVMNRTVQVFSEDVRQSLYRHAIDYAAVTDLYLEEHRSAIGLLAARHREGINPALFRDLEQVHAGVRGFRTLIVVDASGTVVHGAPVKRFLPIMERDPAERNVADRQYFRLARDRGVPLIADGIMGRGFGNDPIVPVSAPLVDAEGRFVGVVEGSLNLPRLGTIGAERDADVITLVMDGAGQLVAAPMKEESRAGAFPLLSRPDFSLPYQHPIVDLPMVSAAGVDYLLARRGAANDWQVFALMPVDGVIEPLEQFFVALGVGVVALVLVVGVVSQAFAVSITHPLHALSELVKDPTVERIQLPDWEHNCPEIIAVERALDEARQLSLDFRQRVERVIDEKTVQLREANAALGAQLLEDPLTGISNRRGLEIGFAGKLSIAEREKLRVTVAMIDVDNFKQVNDEHGHPVGDVCLQQIAARLRGAFRRRGDLVARYGGEEFAVITVSECGETQVNRLEAFRQGIENHRFKDLPDTLSITVSIGVVTGTPEPATQVADLLREADEALYISKRKGRNRLTMA